MIKDKFSILLERTENVELFRMFNTMFTDEAIKALDLKHDNFQKNYSRDMLIEELKTLSENSQDGLIKYYQEKNRKIDILKGIIGINSGNQLIVRCPLAIYPIHKDSLLERDFHSDEQVFGVIRNDNFCILEEIKLKNGSVLFGYIASNNLANNTINFRIIKGFDEALFNPYNSEYDFGELLILSKNEIEKPS